MKYGFLCAWVLTWILGVPAFAAVKIPPTEAFHLSNGVRVILQKDDSQDEASVRVQWRVDHAPPLQMGIPHFVSHLIEAGESGAEFRALQSELGFRSDSSGTDDSLFFQGQVKASKLVDYLRADRKRFARLDVRLKNFEAVLSELQTEHTRLNANFSLWFVESIFHFHVFRDPIYSQGNFAEMREFRDISTANAQEWFDGNFRASSLTLVVVGKFDPSALRAEIVKLWSDYPDFETSKLVFAANQESYFSPSRHEIPLFKDDVSVIYLGYPIPDARHTDTAALDLLCLLLEDKSSGRLTKALVETKLAEGVEATTALSLRPHLFTVKLDVPGTSEKRVLEGFQKAMKELGQTGVTEAELDRVKALRLGMMKERLKSVTKRAGDLAEYDLYYGSWLALYGRFQEYEKVRPVDIQRVLHRYFEGVQPFELIATKEKGSP